MYVPIVSRQQWRDRLKLQGSIKLHTYYTSFHGLWEDIANKRNCSAILKNIVAHLSYLLTGIATVGKLQSPLVFRKTFGSLPNGTCHIYFVLS